MTKRSFRVPALISAPLLALSALGCAAEGAEEGLAEDSMLAGGALAGDAVAGDALAADALAPRGDGVSAGNGTAAAAALDCPSQLLVNTTLDEVNDGGCTSSHCSLREAVQRANDCAGHQLIRVPSGTYRLTRPASNGRDLYIRDSVAIRAVDGARPTISGEDSTRIFRIGNDPNSPIQVTLGGLLLTRGSSTYGGAIYAYGTDLVIENCILERNTSSGKGGAIHSSHSVTLQNSEVRWNVSADEGGGVYSSNLNARINVVDSSITSNEARRGGGIGGQGKLTLFNGVLRRNRATQDGGGAYYLGSALVLSSTVSYNSAGESGGGLAVTHGDMSVIASNLERNTAVDGAGAFVTVGGKLVLDRVKVAYNRASNDGGGVYSEGGGSWPTSVQIKGSVFRDNSAASGAGALLAGANSVSVHRSSFVRNSAWVAGAVYIPQTSVKFYNTTFSGNSAQSGASAIQVSLGGIELKNSTLINDSSPQPLLVGTPGLGTIILAHTLLSSPSGAPNCDPGDPSLGAISHGYNVESGVSCRLRQTTDRSSESPALAPLGSYGGPVVGDDASPEYLLLRPTTASSAARDGGAVTATTSEDIAAPGCLARDARNLTRPQGAACDIGAVEGS
jgi:CSLREA domain-containing protein